MFLWPVAHWAAMEPRLNDPWCRLRVTWQPQEIFVSPPYAAGCKYSYNLKHRRHSACKQNIQSAILTHDCQPLLLRDEQRGRHCHPLLFAGRVGMVLTEHPTAAILISSNKHLSSFVFSALSTPFVEKLTVA
jgi:hypothetical protein